MCMFILIDSAWPVRKRLLRTITLLRHNFWRKRSPNLISCVQRVRRLYIIILYIYTIFEHLTSIRGWLTRAYWNLRYQIRYYRRYIGTHILRPYVIYTLQRNTSYQNISLYNVSFLRSN